MVDISWSLVIIEWELSTVTTRTVNLDQFKKVDFFKTEWNVIHYIQNEEPGPKNDET